MDHKLIRTTCPYCGTGCGLILKVRDDRVVETYPDREHPVSRGHLCVKGWVAHEFVHHPDRLTAPLVKEGDEFHEISWEGAIALAAEKMREIAGRYGGDAIGGLSSAKCTNEENYLFQKLIRAGFKANNVDHCARLCHAPTTVGMVQTLGSGAMTNSIADLAGSDCIFIIGSNAAESHPIIMGEIYKAQDRGARIIVVDPRRTAVAENADIHLAIKPGKDIPLVAGMMRHMVDEGLHDAEFIEKRVEGFEELKDFLALWPVEKAAGECGIDAEVIRNVAELYAKAGESAIVYCMGITQHACGSANVISLCDLAMLCGHVGTEHSGVYPLRGQNNVQGACDMGALPNVYHGYQNVADPEVRDKFQKAWKADLDDRPGLTVTEMIGKAGKEIRALYIMAENPAMSDPDVTHVLESLESLDFLIVQDIFMTETAKFADLVLPASSFAEKTGTFTNTERRFQLVRKAVEPPGNAKDDFSILCLIGNALGLDFSYAGPEEVMEEIADLAPAYGGIRYGRMERAGLQWPCPDEEHPGTPFLHEGRFTRGKGLFVVPEYTPPMELPDNEFPFYLGTGRMFAHYHTGTMTRRSPFLHREYEKAYAEVNPADAERLGVDEGDAIRITTRRGSIVTSVFISGKVSPGTVFVPFHFTEARANMLTNPVLDPQAKTPEFKVCAARVTKEP
ncbi:MAG: formate dehydrogenase subunit alpha [Deltaproteobacteria bacterium]|nr:formate dehydrogenase subunit alpha [Deltaproteobacteria bacterium]